MEVSEKVYSRSRVAIFGATGFIVAIALMASTTMMLPVAKAGTLAIKITDASANLQSLNLTIDSFEVHNKAGQWINVTGNGYRKSFNLRELEGVTTDAATSNLEPGQYDMIRMHIVEGLEFTNATLSEIGVFVVRVPSEKIKIPVNFELSAGLSTTVILDIAPDTEWRIAIASNPEHNLNPVIKPIVTPSS